MPHVSPILRGMGTTSEEVELAAPLVAIFDEWEPQTHTPSVFQTTLDTPQPYAATDRTSPTPVTGFLL